MGLIQWIALAGLAAIGLYIVIKIVWVKVNITAITYTVKQYLIGQVKLCVNKYSEERSEILTKKQIEYIVAFVAENEHKQAQIENELEDEIKIAMYDCKNQLGQFDFEKEFKKIVHASMGQIYWYSIVHGISKFTKFIDPYYYKYIYEKAMETKDIKVEDEYLKKVFDKELNNKGV